MWKWVARVRSLEMKAQVTRLLLGRKEKTTAKGNRKLKQSLRKSRQGKRSVEGVLERPVTWHPKEQKALREVWALWTGGSQTPLTRNLKDGRQKRRFHNQGKLKDGTKARSDWELGLYLLCPPWGSPAWCLAALTSGCLFVNLEM